jgi:putative NADH-flavin reductase
MKIIVFGATGGTGKAVVDQALERGWHVTAIVRHPPALNIDHANLKITCGDVMNPSSFIHEVKGKDAVVSCLGTGTNLRPTTVYSQGMKNILYAMREATVRRIVSISAGAIEATNEMGFFIRLLTRLVLQRILKNLYADMCLMEIYLSQSDTDYTIMRPARLINGKTTRRYRMAINAHLKTPWTISKSDLAHAMLDAIDDTATSRSIIEIAY